MMDRSAFRSTLTLLGGCASVIALAAVWAPPSARAQTAFQGTPVFAPGSATITRGTTDIIELNNSEVVIDWTPANVTGTGTIDFLPAGTTALFRNNPNASLTGYTVLNRILPVDGTGAAVSRVIALNGTVQSEFFGSPGGTVWFYSPGGIVAGPGSVFTVGSLVLTSNDIDTTGGLYGSKGEIRFRGIADSNAAVQVQAGAKINAPAAGSYVALVAPRVVQGGTVTVNGSAAYIAAEQADISINSGLFDIAISTGTTDANGVVHSGTTTGPASTGAADPQRVYMVAVPKNNALTMLLSGSVGYTPAAAATVDGSAIVLSAGYDISGGAPGTTRNATTSANGGFTIGAGDWQNDLTGAATGDVMVQSSTTTATHFLGNVALSAEQAIGLRADQLGAISADKDMSLTAGIGATGGRIDLLALGGSGSAATNGQIAVTGNLTLNASGFGDTGFASVPPLTGADATGGAITINATGGTISAASLTGNAVAFGGYGTGRSGDATGGTISLTAQAAAGPGGPEDGTLRFGGTTLDASASSAFQVSTPPADGGNAFGGSVILTGAGGLLDLGAVDVMAQATGGIASTGTAGSATGGNIGIAISAGAQSWSSLSADVSATAGDTSDGGVYGAVNPGATGIDIDISGAGSLAIGNAVSLRADARSFGGGASGGSLRGGRITVAAHDGGGFTVASDIFASAQAIGRGTGAGATFLLPGTPDAIGGTISIGAAGGTISAAGLYADASGSAGDAPGTAGSGTGGSVTLFASASGGARGNFTLTGCASFNCRVFANGSGGYGMAGANGTGGSILLYASDADFSALGDMELHADGNGGGSTYDGLAGRGGDGLGGNVTVESRLGAAGDGTLTFGNLLLSGEGSSVTSVEGPSYNGGDGGTGTGGTLGISVLGGSLIANRVDAHASGIGGGAASDCPSCEIGGTTPFQAGAGQGGSANFLIAGGLATVGTLKLGATGTGGGAEAAFDPQGVSAIAGLGQGGIAQLESQGGTLQLASLAIDAGGAGGLGGSTFQANAVDGGAGFGGHASLLTATGSTGQVIITGDAVIAALGKGGGGGETGSDGPGFYLAGKGGGGTGGTAELTLGGGALTAPSLMILADGIGGAGGLNGSDGPGGDAGNGAGGTARIAYLSEGHAIGDLTASAIGQGGVAGNNGFTSFDNNNNPIFFFGTGGGGKGGDGLGGTADMRVDVDPAFASLTVSADGIGSMGGGGGTGNAGGTGTGGVATLALGFGATSVSGALRVTAAGVGGLGGTGFDNSGGRGGDAFGGSATFALSGASTLLDAGDIGVLAEALGGAGGASGVRSGTGLNGADGGHATGGTALFSIMAGATATTGAALTVSANATGGAGALGIAGAVGGNGGAGGNAIAGTAAWQIDGGHIAFNVGLPQTPSYSITALGQGGAGANGGDGTDPGLSGGLGGNAGSGAGGQAVFDASNGDYALGGLTLLADGLSGTAGLGGSGPGGASASGAAGLSSGGAASFANGDGGTLMPGAQRLIDSLYASASGASGGRVTFTDSSSAAGGGLRITGSMTLASLGVPVAGVPGISVAATGNVVQIGGNADFTSDGPLSFAFAGGGGMAAGGALTGYSGVGIDIGHLNRPAGADSLTADSILFTTPGAVNILPAASLRAANGLTILGLGGNINLASGSALHAGGDLRLFAQGSLNGAGASVGAAGSAAIGLGGAGDIILGNLSSGGLLDMADASGNALGAGGIATGGNFAVSGLLDIGAGSGSLSAATIGIGTLAADSQQLAASNGAVQIGSAKMSGDLIVNSSLLLGDADIAGLLQVRGSGPAGLAQLTGQVAAGSIDIVANSIAANGLTARTGSLLLQSVTALSVTGAQAAGDIVLTSSTGGLTIGNAVAGSNLALTGQGITAQRLVAGGTSLLNAGTGDLSVTDILSTGAITAFGRNIVLGSAGAMTVAVAGAAGGALTLNGASIDAATLNATGALSATAAGTARFGSVTSQTGDILLNSGGLMSLTGAVNARTITIEAGDIAIAPTAQIGTLSGTAGIVLNALGNQQPAYVGGNDVAGAYSLSAAEIARLAAGAITVNGSSDIIVRDLTLGAANLAQAGLLTIGAGGRLRVEGAVQLTGRSGQGGLSLSGGEAIEILAGSGSIGISDGNGGLAGLLRLSSPYIIAATQAAMNDAAIASSLAGRELRLAQNDGLTNDAGILRAGTIQADVTDAFYIQNMGLSAEFSARRGFTANDLVINTQGGLAQIAINGQLAQPGGTFVRGRDAIALTAINGVRGGGAGGYAAGSKINGCLIGSSGACLTPGFDSRDIWSGLLDPSVAVGRIFTLTLIELRDVAPQGYPPLIDEPVTGAGNEDLWERHCGGPDEPDCGTGQ